ncbi:MAG: dethiobiotin synthase [Rhodocyclaceae bacterium]
MGRSYFITATGTDLGKTWLTAGLLSACRAQGRPARALKPVMSGFDPMRPDTSDAAKIGAGRTAWCYEAPLSPDLAAAKEGKAIDFAALVSWCQNEIAASDGVLLIEGIGGVMVPLTPRHTVRDWIAALAIPTLLVCGTYLGTLSHTLTALAALREVGVTPAMLIVNESAGSAVSVEDTLASLAPHLSELPLCVLRRDDAAGLARLASSL